MTCFVLLVRKMVIQVGDAGGGEHHLPRLLPYDYCVFCKSGYVHCTLPGYTIRYNSTRSVMNSEGMMILPCVYY